MSSVLCAVFFLSGASALIFETLWFRQAGLAFGNSVWASSLVLSGFMGGLAIGNAIAARYGERFGNPLRVYAIAEVAIAATGIGLVYVFPVVGVALAPWFRPLLDQPAVLNAIRLVVAFLLLLIPSTAMGLTLPLVTKVLARVQPTGFGQALGRLYGWNTFGAMFGVVVGEKYLIRAYGVHGTSLMAGGLNVIAAAAAVWLSIRILAGPKGPALPAAAASAVGRVLPDPATGRRWLAAAGVSGFCLLALEVIWFRFLVLFVKGHSEAFPLMLGVVLAGIAAGGLIAAMCLRRSPDVHRFASPVAFWAGVLCVVSYASFPRVVEPLAASTIVRPLAILRVGLPLMLPVSLLSGVLFTLIGAALRFHRRSETDTAGILTLVNTTGAALGSLAAGFVFIPVLGMERSLWLIAALYGAIGLLIGTRRLAAYASASVCVLSLALFPFGQLEARLLPIPVARWAEGSPATRLVAVREGLTETVLFFERLLAEKPVSHVMLTNSFSMSTTGYGVRRYQKLYVYWPMAVHPNLKRALLIGYGVGNTAKAMTDSPGLESIDLVDLSRDILSMSPIVFPREEDQPLRDPRLHVHIEDGRFFLQTTDREFDLITGEPPPPGIAGVENLYSREYFQLIRNRLAEGGLVTYWLPLADLTDVSSKAILHAFCDVFDDCSLWNGSGTNLMMVGGRNPRGPVSEEHFTSQWTSPPVTAEMKRLGFERPEQLGALFIADADYLRAALRDASMLTDDDPKVIEAPFSSNEEWKRLIGSLTDVVAAKERFERSSLIRKLWPDRMREASLPYFEFQRVIDAHLYGTQVPQALAIDDVHRVLTRSALSTPVLWRLASNSDIQQVVSNATATEQSSPLLQFHLGIRLLSERSYAAAAESFLRAAEQPEVRDNAFVLHVYALCMAGQIEQAQALTREAWESAGAPASANLPPFWVWMKETFGIDPSRS